MTILSFKDVSLLMPSPEGQSVLILRDINLTVQEGESISIRGSSGSGKTSLISLACGAEYPTSGTVAVCGKILQGMNEDETAVFRRQHIGVVFQHYYLIPSMTALENVAAPLELAGDREAKKKAASALRETGLGHRLHYYPAQLSGGERQRAALARAFVMRPRLLLADEPTGSLDSGNGKAAADLLFRLQEETRCALILVTHDKALSKRAARQCVMREGRLLEDVA